MYVVSSSNLSDVSIKEEKIKILSPLPREMTEGNPNVADCVKNTKQLFHERALDMRLYIANEALRASLAINDLISNKREWNNCFIKNAQINCNI